jgi:N-hydroxyarylamine O-acetyltransferase
MNLGAYLARIGYHGRCPPTQETLAAIHRAHAMSIPFENLDIQLGRQILLDIGALEHKLVDRSRGGYCFEHNTLAMHALRAIGLDPIACEARVMLGATRVSPRTHMVLLVTLDGERWLWDTGFGGDTPLEPLPFDGSESHQGAASYLIRRQGSVHVVQMNVAGEWQDLYGFVPEPREPVDFEVGNWYTSTHPDSHFVTTLTAQQRTADGSRVLRNLTYAVTTGENTETREIARRDLIALLKDEFALDLPADSRFRALDAPAIAPARSHMP